MNWQTTKRAAQRPHAAAEAALQPCCLRDNAGHALHCSGTVEKSLHHDLARKMKKRMPEAKARDRLLAILDRAAALVAMADQGGALYYVNPAGRTMLGLAPDEDVSRITLIECVAPSVRSGIAEAVIPAALSSGDWSGDCILLARDGRQVEVSLLIAAHRDGAGRLEGLSLLAQNVSAWTSTAAARRVTRDELLRLSAQHMTIQEDERRRIAADLHDGLGQSLGLVIVSLENMANLLRQGEPEKAAEYLQRLNPKVRDTLDELRRIAMNLRPAMLDSLGILATVSWHLREIEAACPGIEIERKFSIDETDVPGSLRTPIFRILQEAGNNAIKHGRANRITVRLSKAHGVLELAIEDNGKGFDLGALTGKGKRNRGFGLQSMSERAQLSGGSCEMQSAPGKGTQVCVRWPPSVKDIGPDRAAAPEPEARAIEDLVFPPTEDSRDMEILHNLSVCVACIRSIEHDG